MHQTDFQDLPIFELLEKDTLHTKSCHVYAKSYCYAKHHTAKKHRHSFYGIELIISGSCTQYINGYRYECHPGFICLFSPFDYHQFQIADTDVSTYCLSFTEDVLTQEVFDVLNKTELPCLLVLENTELIAFMKDFQLLEQEISQEKPMYLSVVNGIVNKLVSFLLRSTAGMFPHAKTRKSDIRYSISYIRNHFREPLSLEEIATHFNVTPNHFCKYFKKITGITFKEYLLQLRLEYAMKQLLLTQSSITDICLESGFNSPSYFSKAFKARFGKAPSAYRE